MKAAQIVQPGAPVEVTEIPIPIAIHDEVVVRITAAGVCHSDLHLCDGGYDLGAGAFLKFTDRGYRYPIIPGHEIVGCVYQIGDQVVDFAIGDHVLVFPWIGCGRCQTCLDGNDNICEKTRSIGFMRNGGYAEYVHIPCYKYLAKISDHIDLDSAASLACSGLTAYNAVKKANSNSPESLVIIGAGGVGLVGIQLAKAVTKAKIICIDIDDERLAIARNLGADFVINSSDNDAHKEITAICSKGVDSIIDFVNAPMTAKLGLSVLRKRGNLVLVGLFGGSLDISLVTIPLKSLTIQGAYTGTYTEMVELLQLAEKGIVKPIISKRYSLQDANTAINDLKQGKIIGRAVIVPTL